MQTDQSMQKLISYSLLIFWPKL